MSSPVDMIPLMRLVLCSTIFIHHTRIAYPEVHLDTIKEKTGLPNASPQDWLGKATRSLAILATAALIATSTPAFATTNDAAGETTLSSPAMGTGASVTPAVVSLEIAETARSSFKVASTPAISGTAKVGSKLTAKVGKWSPKAKFTYQWYRGKSKLKGATKSSYIPVAADRGNSLKVRVTAKATGYKNTSKTSKSRKIAAGTIKPSSKLKISGTARYGSTLSALVKLPSGSKASYQWYKNSKKVSGATKKSYKLAAKDIGAKYQVRLGVTKPGYNKLALSSNTVKISKAVFKVKTTPKISGTKQAGKTLKASAGSFTPKPSSHSYQWLRNGKSIKKATKSSYKLTSSDAGTKISVKVTAKKKHYSNRSSTSTKVPIAKSSTTVIKHDGTYRVGSSLKPGLYKATGTGDSCYWERLNGFSGSFDDINANHFGAANGYVRILKSDKGFSTSGCGSWKKAPSTGAKTSTISKDGSYRVGIDIKPGLYKSTNSGSCYWATLTDFTGGFEDLITNDFNYDRSILVQIPSTAKGFEKTGCGTLKRIG